ncbi:MAG TPA: endolytic transglycosylase MltG [Acidimicrobiales bacterium]|nr:endolytic transglycosylase MltG [Acidimicrobiales bacterium]
MSVDLRQEPPEYFQYEEHGRRWPFVLLALALTFLVLAGSGVLWVQRQVNPPGAPGERVRLTVEQGMSTSDIGSLLEREGVIASADIFKYYVKLTGVGSIEAGDYTLEKKSDLSEVVKVLEGGAAKAEDEKVTVPEGLTLTEVAKVVGGMPGRSAEKFMEVANSGTIRSQYQPAGNNSLEGLILPETYFVSKGDDETKILRKMVDSFDKLATQLNLPGAAAKYGITPYQAVIVASLVEREARVDEDRGKVARVIYNRLEQKMQLQIDATVLYALNRPQESVSFKDREVNSPYNTYKIPGLPPGPIASPGRKSLEATTSPPAGNWTFYVLTDPSGRHSFTNDYREFQNLVNQCIAKGLCG